MGVVVTAPASPDSSPRQALVETRLTPTLTGIGLAGFIALEASTGNELAPMLAASGFV